MKKILTFKGTVFTWECDSNGHMNVMYYINKFENSGHHFAHEMGLSELFDDKTGIVVLEQNIKYLREVFEDDLLHIESSLLDVGNKAFRVLHEMYNTRTKELVCKMNLVLVLFDKVNRKAMLFPEKRREALLKRI